MRRRRMKRINNLWFDEENRKIKKKAKEDQMDQMDVKTARALNQKK